MNRKTWRNIFIGIIILTIPCYIVGIVFWFTGTDGTGLGSEVPIVEPSRTPIDVDQLVTELALTNPALVVTQTPLTIASPTSIPNIGVTPLVPTRFTGSTSVPFFTSTPVTVNTPIPTNTQQLPTNTPIPSNTPIPAQPSATPIPSNTPQVLLPPTDTPSP